MLLDGPALGRQSLDAHADDGVVFLQINSNADEVGLRVPKVSANPGSPKPYARLRDYGKKHGLKQPMYADHHNRVADRLGALATPHVFVFASNGTMFTQNVLQGAKAEDAFPEFIARKGRPL